jgi:hypothetical protein
MVDRDKSSAKHLRAQKAKEFLISQIIEQARRENVLLSEVEQKMLYFTEAEETLPDIYEVNEQFEREYDNSVYEKKIAGLLRNAHRRNQQESLTRNDHWKQAVADLRKEDHYLLVMVDQSLQPASDFWTDLKWSSVLAGISMAAIVLWVYLDAGRWVPRWISDIPFRLWLLGAVVLWMVVKFARMGAFGDVVKDVFVGLRNNFPFAYFKKRKRG